MQTEPKIGDRYGSRVIIGIREEGPRIKWRCDCGTEGYSPFCRLREVQSCGCANRRYELDGERVSLTEAARRAGVNRGTLYKRMEHGMTLKEAMSDKQDWIRGKRGARKKPKGAPIAVKRDYSGEVYGTRTVGSPTRGPRGVVLWGWECTCGAAGRTQIGSIKKSTNCPKCNKADLTGKRFGTRVVTKKAPKTDGHVRWEWECDCGATGVSVPSTLRFNCGVCSADHIGEVHGTRTILKERWVSGGSKHRHREWEWRCAACGEEGCSPYTYVRDAVCPSCRQIAADSFIGQKFGRRTVVGGTSQAADWVCECGSSGITNLGNLRTSRACNGCPLELPTYDIAGEQLTIPEIARLAQLPESVVKLRVRSNWPGEEILLVPYRGRRLERVDA